MTERTPADDAQIRQCKLMIEEAIQAMHEKGFAQEHIDAAMQPAPVTPQEAAKVLLDFLATPSARSPVPHGTLEEIWQATFRESGFLAVRGFLAATATEAGE